MKKDLLVGIDLSFNSTGITVSYLEDDCGTKITFHRLVFETKPTFIKNINQETYIMPTNISTDDLIVEEANDFYSEDQAKITLKCMICIKRIMKIIVAHVEQFKPDNIYFNIEGFVMPSMTGNTQLRVLGGLIMLQGMLRSELIKLKIAKPEIENYKIYITSPSELKLFFTGKGDSVKQDMLEHFLYWFDGDKLLPDTESLAKVNDVIDSFALMINIFYRLYSEIKRKTSKTQKKREEKLAAQALNKKSKKKIIVTSPIFL